VSSFERTNIRLILCIKPSEQVCEAAFHQLSATDFCPAKKYVWFVRIRTEYHTASTCLLCSMDASELDVSSLS
jgi:hypothetical protein